MNKLWLLLLFLLLAVSPAANAALDCGDTFITVWIGQYYECHTSTAGVTWCDTYDEYICIPVFYGPIGSVRPPADRGRELPRGEWGLPPRAPGLARLV